VNAAKRFYPGTLAALHEVNERRADLIEELGLERSLFEIAVGRRDRGRPCRRHGRVYDAGGQCASRTREA